jgi:uncharacterized protein (DUF885 family)
MQDKKLTEITVESLVSQIERVGKDDLQKTQKFFNDSYHLLMDHESIKNEIYRYVCNPGQAVSYKVGSQVFKKIININKWDTINNKNYGICNKIILDGPLPLKFLIDKYKINIDNLFS